MLWYKIPKKVYFKRGSVDLALRELKGKKKAFIITDRFLFNSDAIRNITRVLDDICCDYEIFFDIKTNPTLSIVNEAYAIMKPYEPDCIIALGGGSPMDVAKMLWLKYEEPELKFEDVAMRFVDISKNIYDLPELGKKASLVCIPTTSGTGSEVTPFSIITDDKTGERFTVAGYTLTPTMAIVDANFVDNMPKKLTAASGIDALVHAIEAYVSSMATNFTNSNALEAIKLTFRYLSRSYHEGKNDPIAREKMHYVATIAGMAFANSFLGICHPMAHKLGAAFNIPYGVANALLIKQVIKFNATCAPESDELPQYKSPCALKKYGQIADELNLKGNNDIEKTDKLINEIENLMKDIELPNSIEEYGISEKEFNSKLSELVDFAPDSAGKNPMYPTKEELKEIYKKAYKGTY